ncbi:MAG: hypothetical protein WCH40_12655 [Verrucomicrobiales bacterium]
MDTREPISFVDKITATDISVVCRDGFAAKQVKALGGKRSIFKPRTWKIHFNSQAELASVLSALRDARVAMAGALAGWPPAAVFEQLREEGKLSGKFTEIVWSRPGEEVLSEK